jgi:hypothetical protein
VKAIRGSGEEPVKNEPLIRRTQMGSTFTRWTTGLLAVTAIAGGTAFATTMGASAQATDSTRVTSTVSTHLACTRAHGKYAPHLLKSYKITGGDDSVHGIPGGTLQIWGSVKCGTAWVKTVKLPKYATRAYLTVAGIASYDTGLHRWNQEQRSELTTRSNVESPAVATGTRSGRLRVQGGFVGPYQFDSAHTYRF